jgi:tRNA threonylcarbamoyladenosine biosynthesis protein TsaE
MTKISCKSTSKLPEIARALLEKHKEKRIFLLRGAMGAGKTTFMQAVAKELQSKDIVSSPTFAIVNQYETLTANLIYHFDFYRIKNLKEALDIGFEEYLYSGEYCFIEWAENVEELLDDDAVNIYISVDVNNQTRTFSF